jgi:hypothetical protein
MGEKTMSQTEINGGIELLCERKSSESSLFPFSSLPSHSQSAAQERCGGEVPRNPTTSTERRAPPTNQHAQHCISRERGRLSSINTETKWEKKKVNQNLRETLSQDPTFVRMRLRTQHREAEFQKKKNESPRRRLEAGLVSRQRHTRRWSLRSSGDAVASKAWQW